MRRFYVDPEDVLGNSIIIRGEEANHIKNAVRMQVGDEFVAFDGSSTDYTCRVNSVGKSIGADIIGSTENKAEPSINVTLYQAYPKSAKMNEIVQKAVELGAVGIVPFLSVRCVKRPEGQGDKLGRVALSAVKQCGRSVLPTVTDVQSFEDALELMKRHEQLIVCWEEERQVSLRQALESDAKDIGIVIGSEGGFDAEEVDQIREMGGVIVTLGRRIMRTDTAGMAVLSAIFYDKGQMEY